MTAWVDAHAVEILIGWYIFSAAVSGMPAPGEASGAGYRWLYHSLHLLAGDLARLLRMGDPQS
ncbi:MAG: hypothetical protein ACTHJX_13795 [Terriglobales bacterium]|jgi:hypothetical protein